MQTFEILLSVQGCLGRSRKEQLELVQLQGMGQYHGGNPTKSSCQVRPGPVLSWMHVLVDVWYVNQCSISDY